MWRQYRRTWMPRPEFEELVVSYDKRLFNAMYAMTGDYHEALDLTEEAFVNAYRAYGRFRGDSDPFTWLYRIAVNVLKKRHRKRTRRARLWDEHVENDPPATIDTETPESATLSNERDAIVRRAIAELPEAAREVITLRYISGLTYEEIARATGCSVGTVKSRLSRAKAALGTLLEGKV